jgi:hypothetical protein
MTNPKTPEAAKETNTFTDDLPVRPIRIAPGEYKICSVKGPCLFYVDGAAFAEWICEALNNSQQTASLSSALEAARNKLSDRQNNDVVQAEKLNELIMRYQAGNATADDLTELIDTADIVALRLVVVCENNARLQAQYQEAKEMYLDQIKVEQGRVTRLIAKLDRLQSEKEEVERQLYGLRGVFERNGKAPDDAPRAIQSLLEKMTDEDRDTFNMLLSWARLLGKNVASSENASLRESLDEARKESEKLRRENGRLREIAIDMPDGINVGTEMLVRDFASALAEKLFDAEIKYGYSDGWSKPDWMDECRQKLIDHVEKGDPRDVAAYCAFLWYHKEKTSLASLTAALQERDEAKRDYAIIRDDWNQIEAKHEADIKSISDDYGRTIDSLCNYAWQKVYGEGRTDWEYPAQAIRHLVDYAGEKEKEVEKLKAENAELIAKYESTDHAETYELMRRHALIMTDALEAKELAHAALSQLGGHILNNPEPNQEWMKGIIATALGSRANSFGWEKAVILSREDADGLYKAMDDLASLRQELSAAKERGTGFAKSLWLQETNPYRDCWQEGWRILAPAYNKYPAVDYLHAIGLLEKHPENEMLFRWTAASKQEEMKDETPNA